MGQSLTITSSWTRLVPYAGRKADSQPPSVDARSRIASTTVEATFTILRCGLHLQLVGM